MNTKILYGTVHGRTIELEEDLGLDGSKVEVVLRFPDTNGGSGQITNPLSAGGMLAEGWTDEDDRLLAEIAEDRKRRRERECDP